MKDLNDMMVFLQVVEQGGFSAAAAAIDLPKSNISRKVTRLEQALGVRLLERSTRKQHLTEIGEVYYQHCQRISQEMQSAQLCVQRLMSKPVGTLKVCTSIAVGQSLLSPQLAAFRQAYPDVMIDLQLTNRVVDIIEEGFDIALRVGKLADSNLVAKRLFDCDLFLYASPDYLTQQTPLTEPQQLTTMDCLYMNVVKRKPQWQLNGPQGREVINLNPVVCCNDFAVLRQMALDGAGITELAPYMVEQDVRQGDLVRVLPQWFFDSVSIYAVYPSHKGVTPKVRAFLDHLLNL